uniref:Putative secreted protein n=1 Tax=Ixodes ricinus TaxID=34613 RepID=A0A6B0U1A0_IXORI
MKFLSSGYSLLGRCVTVLWAPLQSTILDSVQAGPMVHSLLHLSPACLWHYSWFSLDDPSTAATTAS